MNYASIKGNITREIELKYTPKGTAVTEFSVAVNEVWYDQAKTKHEQTHFIGCVAWGNSAENIGKYFSKGMPILVWGSLSQESWDDKETGKKREKTKIKVDGFDFCGGDKKPSQQTERTETTKEPNPRRVVKPDPDLDADTDSDKIPMDSPRIPF